MESKRKIIFLTRKHPGSIGGVQSHSLRLREGLGDHFEIDRIGWNGPEWAAPIYFPMFYLKTLARDAGLVHCDDAVTALIGARIKEKSSKKVVATVHGLDVVIPIPWYQRKLRDALRMLDKIICVSGATAEQVRNRGIPEEKIEIIPNVAENGVSPRAGKEELYRLLLERTGIDLRRKKILFSLGRPLRRKGFDYFITEVLPRLPEEYVYIAGGPEPKAPAWIKTARPILGEKNYRLMMLASGCDTVHLELKKLNGRPGVHYLNGVSDDTRDMLFSLCDIFVMPNRTVEGDMEGFGIVALEAAVRGKPVVATGIEGITDAVINGQNGFCVAEGDAAGMANVIRSLGDNPERLRAFGLKAKEFTEQRFSPAIVYGRYKDLFEKLLNGDGG